MPDLVDQAAAALRSMQSVDRDSIAHAILSIATRSEYPLDIDPGHLQDVITGLAEIDRGELASNEEAQAAFRSFDS